MRAKEYIEQNFKDAQTTNKSKKNENKKINDDKNFIFNIKSELIKDLNLSDKNIDDEGLVTLCNMKFNNLNQIILASNNISHNRSYFKYFFYFVHRARYTFRKIKIYRY